MGPPRALSSNRPVDVQADGLADSRVWRQEKRPDYKALVRYAITLIQESAGTKWFSDCGRRPMPFGKRYKRSQQAAPDSACPILADSLPAPPAEALVVAPQRGPGKIGGRPGPCQCDWGRASVTETHLVVEALENSQAHCRDILDGLARAQGTQANRPGFVSFAIVQAAAFIADKNHMSLSRYLSLLEPTEQDAVALLRDL
jgi:hypothetical protein